MVCLIKEHWKTVPASCKDCRETVLRLVEEGEIPKDKYEVWLELGGIPQ